MIDKFSDILDNIKDRFSNPLIFSFICAWIFLNWKITVALLWYDPRQISGAGFNSIFEFISTNITFWRTVLAPTIFALGYTFTIPIIKNVIKAFYSWTSKWGENWNLKIIDNGKISVNKYLRLRSENDKRTKLLESVIDDESQYLENNRELTTKLLHSQAELNKAEEQVSIITASLNQLTNVKVLNGNWTCQWFTENKGNDFEKVLISDGRYFIYSEETSKQDHVFDLNDFHHREDGYIFFVKELIETEKKKRHTSEHYNINRLKLENDDLLEGYENGYKIRYRRI